MASLARERYGRRCRKGAQHSQTGDGHEARIFRASRIGWFERADELPKHERFRPDTRGLEGSQPPD
ncbi:MAG TPA: hypothetical protein VMK31_02795 [Sphingomicrobium sp.]|nr:hypothetical protein [Sphingomicrobium sp.]